MYGPTKRTGTCCWPNHSQIRYRHVQSPSRPCEMESPTTMTLIASCRVGWSILRIRQDIAEGKIGAVGWFPPLTSWRSLIRKRPRTSNESRGSVVPCSIRWVHPIQLNLRGATGLGFWAVPLNATDAVISCVAKSDLAASLATTKMPKRRCCCSKLQGWQVAGACYWTDGHGNNLNP